MEFEGILLGVFKKSLFMKMLIYSKIVFFLECEVILLIWEKLNWGWDFILGAVSVC